MHFFEMPRDGYFNVAGFVVLTSLGKQELEYLLIIVGV